jgi:hypothetical protein
VSSDIAVIGEAAADADFKGGFAVVRYRIDLADTKTPLRVQAKLWYQPIGFRWAHNLAGYKAMEPQRFVGYYDEMARNSAIVLATAETTIRQRD